MNCQFKKEIFKIKKVMYFLMKIIQYYLKEININIFLEYNLIEKKFVIVKAKNLTIKIIAKKIRNKNVTLISGLENYIDNINTICKSLAKHFATSVTVKDEISGLKNAIFIQGHWVDELVEKLIEEFKINKRIIKVEDRLKTKKKK
jgi:translation initiation factor 1 (eIF-1/SUI1)